MKRSAFARFRRYVCRGLRLEGYLDKPGDGRRQPRIAARDLLWSLLAGQLLRLRATTDPFELARTIEKKLDRIAALGRRQDPSARVTSQTA